MLTIREHEVLDFIKEFKKVNGYSPTVKEIANGVNTKSTTHIRDILADLKTQGYITYKEHKARTIVVLKF